MSKRDGPPAPLLSLCTCSMARVLSVSSLRRGSTPSSPSIRTTCRAHGTGARAPQRQHQHPSGAHGAAVAAAAAEAEEEVEARETEAGELFAPTSGWRRARARTRARPRPPPRSCATFAPPPAGVPQSPTLRQEALSEDPSAEASKKESGIWAKHGSLRKYAIGLS